MAASSTNKVWRKNLWEKQDFPDNYVDESFLLQLRKNINTRTYSFWPAVVESGVVTQQISSVVLFSAAFVYMNDGYLDPKVVFATLVLLTLLGYVLYKVAPASVSVIEEFRNEHLEAKRHVSDDVKIAVTFLAIAYGMAPILHTLTESISTDTIYAMSTGMLLANLIFYEYGPSAAIVSATVSFNAAMFASVCLASRLPTTWHTFATVTLAASMFALFPLLRKRLKMAYGAKIQVAMTTILGIPALLVSSQIYFPCGFLFLLLHLFITFACPTWLICIQPFKDNIHGPWDEAEIKECDKVKLPRLN